MQVPYSTRRGKRGIFLYRRRVPAELQGEVGAAFWKISLKTADEREALTRAMRLATEHNELIAHRGALAPVDKARLALEGARAVREKQARDGREAQAAWIPRRDAPAAVREATQLRQKRDQIVEATAARLLAEAEKLLTGLAPAERAVVDGAGGVKALYRQSSWGEAINRMENEFLAFDDEGEELSAQELEDRREVEKAKLDAEARQLHRKRKVLEKLKVVGADESETPDNPRLLTVLERWLRHKKQGLAAQQRHRVSVRRFVELHGNVPVREITQAQVLAYRDFCETIPDTRRVSAEKRRGDLRGLKSAGLPVISPRTVERHLVTIKALLKWCIPNVANFGTGNVAAGVVAAKDDRKRHEIARGFTQEELALIFDKLEWHYDPTRARYRARSADMVWLVWTACYSGCRLEEMAQLARDNVRQIGDVWVLDINDEGGRKLKNEQSSRLVPVHPVLLKRGFVKWAKEGDSKRVFSSFIVNKTVAGRSYGHAASASFGRYLDNIGLKDRAITFHSFRHTFVGALRNARVPYSAELAIVGHADKVNPVHGKYGGPAGVKVLAKEMARVEPRGLT